jgi:hypothetical protein
MLVGWVFVRAIGAMKGGVLELNMRKRDFNFKDELHDQGTNHVKYKLFGLGL